jgi:hypothetical protein
LLQPGCSHVKRRGRPLRLDRFLVGARCPLSAFSMANSSICLPPWAYVVVLVSIEMLLGVTTPPPTVRRGNSGHLGATWGYVRGREDPELVQKRMHGTPSTLAENSRLTDSMEWICWGEIRCICNSSVMFHRSKVRNYEMFVDDEVFVVGTRTDRRMENANKMFIQSRHRKWSSRLILSIV